MTHPEKSRVSIELTRTVTVSSQEGRPALEIKAVGDNVSVTVLPKNGARRGPVKLDDLALAVEALKS